MFERFQTYFAARDWPAMAEMLADGFSEDDRRRVVNAGIRHGRDAEIEGSRAAVDLGVTNATSAVIATRGDRVALLRTHYSDRDQARQNDVLQIVEIDAEEQMGANVVFDLDDIEAAFEELDARYLAGEAAAHARTWSVVAGGYAALNRHEVPPTTPDFVNTDHRRGIAFEPGDMIQYIRATFDVAPDVNIRIMYVHRLSSLGVVVTHAAYGTSQEGFGAEWREIALLTVDGDLVNRCEMFDETDVDAAVARFEELGRPAPRLQNAASQVNDRFDACFAARDWGAMAELLTDDTSTDDRRRVVNAGIRQGRDVEIASMRSVADIGVTNATSVVIAVRGRRLALSRTRFSGRDQGPEAFVAEMIDIVEIDADERIAARVAFDPDDIDAAFEELDARYNAGEAAAHAHTWSVIAQAIAAVNRHEIPPTTPESVTVDCRRLATIEAGHLVEFIRTAWDLTPDRRIYIETVHQLSKLGAVVTRAAYGTSTDGFDAEWRGIDILTVDGELIDRCELFDEADVDSALARFDELGRSAPLVNAAIRTRARVANAINRRDLNGLNALRNADGRYEDRRKGLRDDGPAREDIGRASFATMPETWRIELEPVAIRGSHLGLTRDSYCDTSYSDRTVTAELLTLTEVDDEGLVRATILFDPDDLDAAFAELDARYVAGEATAHSRTWSVIAGAYAALNRRELAAVAPDWVNVDRRRLAMIEAGHLAAYIRASGDAMPDRAIHVEAVHRLSSLGAVVSRAVNGTSQDGFYAEWREIDLLTVDGDLINRCEVFDEADLDVALARFDELSTQAPVLGNAATRARTGLADAFNRRDLDGFLALLTPDGRYEDRRKGLRDEGIMRPNVAQAVFEAPKSWRLEIEPIAIRGSHLGLTRERYCDTSYSDRTVTAELLMLTEVNDEGLICRTILFDLDDIDGAVEELDTRWIASGEVAHPQVIEAVRRLIETVNRHDWDAFAALSDGATYVNHRQLSSPGVQTIADHMSSIRTMASLVPDYWVELAEVLTYSARGLVGDVFLRGTAADGLAIEIPLVMLLVVDRDRVTGFEAFDPDRRDSALARFEELSVKD